MWKSSSSASAEMSQLGIVSRSTAAGDTTLGASAATPTEGTRSPRNKRVRTGTSTLHRKAATVARRWTYGGTFVRESLKVFVVRGMGFAHKTPRAALRALSLRLEDDVRAGLNAIDAINSGKVTRTWVEKRK